MCSKNPVYIMPQFAIPPEAPQNCPLCPRLMAFRNSNRISNPDWFNNPVPSFGPTSARLIIVGLAPGLKGANRTGRPFTGDYAGELLYATLLKSGFAQGCYGASVDDTLKLKNCIISNAVRCVPPENKPTPKEIKTCRPFLRERLENLKKLKAILALGRIAHEQTLAALNLKLVHFKFAHGARHALTEDLTLFDSYHCSRYNTNTGRLTPLMFEKILEEIRIYLKKEE